MKKLILLFLLCFITTGKATEDFYELQANKINGEVLNFSELKGKTLMIVNVASLCGFTYQYAELQSLYNQFGGDKFEIIAFPSNDFGNQEPGSDDDIEDFCKETYGVTFTLMSKIKVKGPDIHPVYQWITQKSKNGVVDQDILWNFQKYIINDKGRMVALYGSNVSPLHDDIVSYLTTATSVDFAQTESISINVFPNPSTDILNVKLNELVNNSNLTIYNSFGRAVYEATINDYELSIDVSGFSVGTYLIRYGGNMQKFVVTK